MRADRLISLLMLLQTHGRLPAPDLARRLEVSVRTVLRDVEALSGTGVPVYTERGRHGGIALLPGWRTDVSGFTTAEARALFAGTAAVDASQAPALRSALLKLLAATPADQRAGLTRAAERIVVEPAGWWRAPADNRHLAALQSAVFSDRRVQLGYRHSGDEVTRQRTVDPLGLVAKGGAWYLVAVHRGDPRLFRVDRVRSVTPRAEPVGVHPPLAEVWERLRAQVERSSVPAVVVRFRVREGSADRVLRIIDTQLVEPPSAAPAVDGWREVEARFRAPGGARGTLFGFGTDVEVLGPPEVVADLVRTARALVGFYAGRAPGGGTEDSRNSAP